MKRRLILISLIFAFNPSPARAETIHSTLIKNHQQPEDLLGISLLSTTYPAHDSPYIDFKTVDGEYKKLIRKYYYSLGLDVSDLEINSDGLDSRAKSYSLSAGWAF